LIYVTVNISIPFYKLFQSETHSFSNKMTIKVSISITNIFLKN